MRLAGVCLLAGLAVLRPASPASADIFKYVDDRGVTHFTNAPVDARYEVHQKSPGGFPVIGLGRGVSEGRYDEHILTNCHAYELEPALAKAVMKAESAFDPRALSSKGAIGLMQLMPETAQRLGVANPWDPAENIEGGVKYLSTLVRQFGSVELAAAAYNAGENAVIKYGGIPPYAETRSYVKAVRRNLESYRLSGFGGGAVPVADGKSAPAPKPLPIVAVKRRDGVTIYTNTPWIYADKGK
jgi:soluble lytic murein transglycosylase